MAHKTTCSKCQGSGLIGQGPNPHLREGRTEVCPDCNGTGFVEEGEAEDDQGVDKPVSSAKAGGILGWIKGLGK